MKLSEAKGFFKTRIELGRFFGVEDSEIWVELREPEESETFRFSSNDAKANADALKKMWKDCFIGHNFVEDDGETPCDNKKVIEVISKKGWAVVHIITEWNKQIPLASEKDTD